MTEPCPSTPSDDDARRAVEAQISFVLAHPGMSAWLKSALSGALERHPIDVLNDLEILDLILRRRSDILLSDENPPRRETPAD